MILTSKSIQLYTLRSLKIRKQYMKIQKTQNRYTIHDKFITYKFVKGKFIVPGFSFFVLATYQPSWVI